MARTGRPPKPVEAKRRDGTVNVTRDHKTPLVIGGRSVPEPSEYLTEGQRECFDEIVAVLREANILDRADAGMIELAAIERANVIVCNATLSDEGSFIEGAMGGRVEHPASKSRAKSLSHLRQLYGELGIGPASRARLQNLGVAGRPVENEIPGVAAFRDLKAVGRGA